jgi:D-glucuronyl C5-epimerase C-terminus
MRAALCALALSVLAPGGPFCTLSPAAAARPALSARAHSQVLLILGPHGRIYTRRIPLAGAAAASLPAVGASLRVSSLRAPTGVAYRAPRGRPGATAARARRGPHTHGPSVTAALQSLQRSGALSESAYQQDSSEYLAAQRALARLSGTRRIELASVIANVQAIAASGGFIPSRLPALFLTLARNRQWWTTGPLLSGSQRVSFPGSKLVWEYYPGQGIEIQWLGTFGEGNGYYLSGHENGNLRQLLGEVLPLATQRAGGIAWEYLFQFDGGLPPWTSGLSQGTALQVLARAWSRFKETAYLTAAQQALGVFQTPPPVGVRVPTPAGAHYLEYTYAPRERILNGFIQAVVGLYDYASITKDPLGLQLFEAGDAEARAEVPHYDTGAWSLYDQSSESDLSYHELLTEFLKHLCQRTRSGPPFAPVAPGPGSGGGTPSGGESSGGGSAGSGSAGSGSGGSGSGSSGSGSSGSGSSGSGGGSSGGSPSGGGSSAGGGASAARAHGSSAGAPLAPGPDAIYCATEQHFTSYLHVPPVIALLTRTLRGGTRGGVQLSLSKISTVGLTVRQGGRVVWSNRATVERGKPRLLWVTPRQGGTFGVTLTATDLAGNSATATGTIAVTRAAHAH